jgi:hypothetical protein
MTDIALFLSDKSGNMAEPWAESGYECWCIDIQHEGERVVRVGDGEIRYIGADLRRWLPPRREIAFVFAFPPCTHLAVSGARWFADKGLSALADGLDLVDRCRMIAEWSGAPWGLENPVSTLSTYWRKPDHSFDPSEYAGYLEDPSAEAYTKRTCLWTGGGFIMPERRPVAPVLGSKMHLMSPSVDRADRRSETPRGFARAVWAANSKIAV